MEQISEICLKYFNKFNPYPGKALLHHNLRIYEFAKALIKHFGVEDQITISDDILLGACHLHDFGLFFRDKNEPSYLKRSWQFIAPKLEKWGVDAHTRTVFRDILYYNHSLHSVKKWGIETEIVRKAVHMEHSLGIVSSGLGRKYFKLIEKKYPRFNFKSTVIDFTRITLQYDKPKQILPMFWPNF